MARTILQLAFSDFQTAENTIKEILYANHFQQMTVRSEVIWKKGGMLMGGQCLSVRFAENHVTIEAWITPFLGGEDEYDLNGISAIVPRSQLLKTIDQIKIAIR